MNCPKPLLGLLLLLSALVVLSYQEEMSCYSCESKDKAECDNATTVQVCPKGKDWLCFKAYKVAKNFTTYAKYCSSQARCDRFSGRCQDVGDGIVCTRCCNGDKCNGGEIRHNPLTVMCYNCRGDSEEECLDAQEIKACKARNLWQCAAYTIQRGDGPVKYRKGCLGKKICKDTEGEVCKKLSNGAVRCYTCCEGELCNSGKIKAANKTKCYACQSKNKTECENEVTEINCRHRETRCAKIAVGKPGAIRYAKSCTTKENCDASKAQQCQYLGNGVTSCVECCEGDMCNDGEMPAKRAKCYACDSKNKNDCENEATEITCKDGQTRCAKETLGEPGAERYLRGCVTKQWCDLRAGQRCQDMGHGQTSCVECCEGDMCNDGEMPALTEKRTLSGLLAFEDE